jgi:hypothetical protein
VASVRPEVRAGRLYQLAGREPFELDVRALKGLGLTERLDVGYRLSPRGRALLDVLRASHATGDNGPEMV